jgi:phosphoribosylamine--glycine ligase
MAWKLRQSPRLGRLWTTHPDNPGLAALADPIDVPFSMREAYRTEQFCKRNRIGLVVVGPEEPLAQGIADKLANDETLVFGPGAEAARLEADKAWAKEFMRSALIPTADGRIFTDPEAARSYLESRETAHVVKAAGLAKGKGVIVAGTQAEAIRAVERIMVQREFGAAGDRIVIEERLEGPEVSVFALVDGRGLYILDACQDHKRLGEGDTGPNTGGMGAFCPTPVLDARTMADVQSKILIPTIDALRRDSIEFRGLLYAGLMLTPGGPKVLEFNVRFGDPECQCLLPRLRGDLLELLWATAAGRLSDVSDIEWDSRASCCIVLASPGYPDNPTTGGVIEGVREAESMPDVTIFHAGTARDKQGNLVTAGGRVLNVVGLGDTLPEARDKALAACDLIRFEGKQLRRDIGERTTKRKKSPVPAR